MMASSTELRIFQKDKLYDLLVIEKRNPGLKIKGLAGQIRKAKSVMEQEDIAHIEKLVAQEED